MLKWHLAIDETYPVVGCDGDDAHHGKFIDSGSENYCVEKDEGQLRHQQIDVLVIESSECYRVLSDYRQILP